MLVLIGAGGHCKVVIDALLAAGNSCDTIEVRDQDQLRSQTMLLGIPVKCFETISGLEGPRFHIAIGMNAIRRQFSLEVERKGDDLVNVIHPDAGVSRFSTLGKGVFLAACSRIGPAASIGDGVIVNHHAVVDHDCRVGEYSHIAPGVILGGGVGIGRGVLVGSGAVVLPGISIGDGTVIGAGAVVTRNVGDNEVWVGTPARKKAEV